VLWSEVTAQQPLAGQQRLVCLLLMVQLCVRIEVPVLFSADPMYAAQLSAMSDIWWRRLLPCRRKRKRAAEEKNQKLKSPNFAVSAQA
jgi:hypothetical protein